MVELLPVETHAAGRVQLVVVVPHWFHAVKFEVLPCAANRAAVP